MTFRTWRRLKFQDATHLRTLNITELHHFSDASSQGYGQCTYLRLVGEDKVSCSLVMGKVNVALAVISAAVSSMLGEG